MPDEKQYFWNRCLGSTFLSQAKYHPFLTPIMQGFVGQRQFSLKRDPNTQSRTEFMEYPVAGIDTENGGSDSEPSSRSKDFQQGFLLTLISRRSIKRSGLRYLRRGVDDDGNCANSVETEQILSAPTWDSAKTCRSFVQYRGSVPLYFSQTPYSFKPVPILYHSQATNQAAFERHFNDLTGRYGAVQVAVLVDRHGGEAQIGQEYERYTERWNEHHDQHKIGFEWFDFHAECRGMKFENVDRLVKKLDSIIQSYGETVIEGSSTIQRQVGVIRTNCMDCLDRTNVAQSAFAQHMLQKALEQEGFAIDLVHDVSTQWFNTLWADNGDAISRQYASTSALKGDFTRTRKRNYRGALNDLGLTLSRYYNNMVNDYFSQAIIDVLLGNVSAKVFEDFDTSMMSADPGISIDKIRQNAIETCTKIVVQDPGEELIQAWTLLSPAQPHTLRTLPFEETVLLLTDAALYSCKFDWTTEKIASFEKVDLRAISKINFGTYITSTFSKRQIDEDTNVGVVVLYKPGKESVMRVNTRSLQSAVHDDKKAERGSEDSHSPVLNWLSSRPQFTSRFMAFKIISDPLSESTGMEATPTELAMRICEAIQRACRSGRGTTEALGGDMIEKVDIISVAEARKRTGYIEQLGHSIKKLVWA